MAFLKWRILLEVLSVFAVVTLEFFASGSSDCFNGSRSPSYCSNDSVSCSCQLPYSNSCMVASFLPSDCAKWTFNIGGFSPSLGSLVLKNWPSLMASYQYSVFNVTFIDIKWTSLRFRFMQHGYYNKYFCREFHVSSEYNIPELFYDCRWTKSEYEGTPFTFEYEARNSQHTEARRYVMKLPFYANIEPGTKLQNWTSFLYTDESESPLLTAKWQQAPSHFGVQKYRLQVFRKVEGSEINLQASEVIQGTNEGHELSFNFDTFPASGVYHFEVCILSDNCTNGVCQISKSPDVTVRGFITRTLIAGVIGCAILIPLFLFVLWMWKKQFKPLSGGAKLPVVLIIYTPSQASHIKSVVALTEYLRNQCFVEALLDQLDIPDSETKDPFMWCNEAFSRADFVMVVSSPPKCCNQEGIFRNVDVVALRFFKEKFSKCNYRPQFFSILMPYCTEKDIPEEAKNLRMFKLTKDLDRMLWYIHNGGRFPTVLDSARTLLGPKLRGGKSDLNNRGNIFLAAMKEAEYDLVRGCNCKNQNVKENDNHDTEIINYLTKLRAPCEGENNYERNLHKNASTDDLMASPEPLNLEFPFLLDDLDLTGNIEMNVEPIKKNSEAVHLGFDLNTMKL